MQEVASQDDITRMGQVSGGVETEATSGGEGCQETDQEMDEGGGMPRVKRETPDDPHNWEVVKRRRERRQAGSAGSTGGGQGGRAQLSLAPMASVIPEESQTLLAQLRYGKVIKKISEIRELTNEDIKKMGEEMTLPRIIVIGNESSGKSSTLERIAGQAVLPCAAGICTRAPVVLELKYDPEAVVAQIFFKGFKGKYVQVGNAEEARTKVQAVMETLKVLSLPSLPSVLITFWFLFCGLNCSSGPEEQSGA